MKCPICGHAVPPNTDRCPDCGYRCRATQTQAPITDNHGYYTPPNQTKRPRGCCCALILIVPILLGLATAVLSLASYVMEDFSPENFGIGIYEEEPIPEPNPDALPDEADESCFSMNHGAVTFLPDRWNGDRVLRVPETVDGETVTALAPGCFRDCDLLTTIVLPDTIVEVGREAFAGCTELRGLFLPQGTEQIGPRAFAGCINLESIYIPGSLVKIAPGCFDDCAALLYLFYEGDFESWNALYSDFINPFTTAICLDGNYYQGADA